MWLTQFLSYPTYQKYVYKCVNNQWTTFATMKFSKPVYNNLNSIVIWLLLFASMITCPVKKAVNTYHHLPVNTRTVAPNPGLSISCNHHETQYRFSTTVKEKKATLPAIDILSNHRHIQPIQDVVVNTSDYPVFTNGPPLFLRHRQILV